jgi:hypothetical protein
MYHQRPTKELTAPISLSRNSESRRMLTGPVVQWATFVNYLLPGHMADANNDVADRKLQAEVVEGIHNLGLNQGERPRSGVGEVNAQLQHLRQQTSSNTTDKLETAELTISEWNEGFFRPRGIHIISIDHNAEAAVGEESSRNTSSQIPWQEEPESLRNTRRGFLRNPFIEAGPQGFRMGPIIVSQIFTPLYHQRDD